MSRPLARSSVAGAAAALALVAAAPAGAIYHGTPVAAGDAPWSVTLTARSVACGGALIAPDRVLTAAHCVQGVNPGRLRVRLGGGRWQTARRLAWRGAVMPATYHLIPSPSAPEDPASAAAVDDIAVILLSAPVTDVAPLRLADAPPAAGSAATTIGRGRTGAGPEQVGADVRDPGAPTDAPRAATQLVAADAACLDAYAATLFRPADHLCTVGPDPARAQACAGDSGSPILVDGAAAAVVSWGGETRGRDCGGGLPDVGTRVLPPRDLVTATALAPYALRRVRVRRHGDTLRCVAGTWKPASARFAIRWWRRGPVRRVRDPQTGATAIRLGLQRTVSGTGRTRRASGTPLGCSVTARTAGGWATEDSYNLL
jgi:secreted trypsin-like serine protease